MNSRLIAPVTAAVAVVAGSVWAAQASENRSFPHFRFLEGRTIAREETRDWTWEEPPLSAQTLAGGGPTIFVSRVREYLLRESFEKLARLAEFEASEKGGLELSNISTRKGHAIIYPQRRWSFPDGGWLCVTWINAEATARFHAAPVVRVSVGVVEPDSWWGKVRRWARKSTGVG